MPGLEVLPWDQVVVDDEIRRATAAFLGASPQVTPVAGAPGMWWIGATGLDAVGGEHALAKALLALARAGIRARASQSRDSCVAARAANVGTRGQGQRPAARARNDADTVTIARESRVTSHDSLDHDRFPPGGDRGLPGNTAPVAT